MDPIHLVAFLAIIVVAMSLLDFIITFIQFLLVLLAEWFMDKSDERRVCKHEVRSTSYVTQVTRCFECGEVLD